MGDSRELAGYAVVAGAGLVAVGLVPMVESAGEWVFFGPFLALTAFLGWRAMTHDRVGGLVACALLWVLGMGGFSLSELTADSHGVAYKAAVSGVLAGTIAIGAGTLVLARGVSRARDDSRSLAGETSGEGEMGDRRKLAGYAVIAGAGLVAIGLAPRMDHGEWGVYGPFLALTAFGGWRAMRHPRLPVGGLVACALLWGARGIGALSEVTAAGYGVAYKAAAFGVFAGTAAIGTGTFVLARGVGRPKASGTRVLLAFLAWMVAAIIAYGVPVWLGWCSRQIEPGPFCLDSPPWWLFVQVGLMIGAPWLMWKKTRWLSAASKSSPTDEPSTNA